MLIKTDIFCFIYEAQSQSKFIKFVAIVGELITIKF
jgi:hypothetical protein